MNEHDLCLKNAVATIITNLKFNLLPLFCFSGGLLTGSLPGVRMVTTIFDGQYSYIVYSSGKIIVSNLFFFNNMNNVYDFFVNLCLVFLKSKIASLPSEDIDKQTNKGRLKFRFLIENFAFSFQIPKFYFEQKYITEAFNAKFQKYNYCKDTNWKSLKKMTNFISRQLNMAKLEFKILKPLFPADIIKITFKRSETSESILRLFKSPASKKRNKTRENPQNAHKEIEFKNQKYHTVVLFRGKQQQQPRIDGDVLFDLKTTAKRKMCTAYDDDDDVIPKASKSVLSNSVKPCRPSQVCDDVSPKASSDAVLAEQRQVCNETLRSCDPCGLSQVCDDFCNKKLRQLKTGISEGLETESSLQPPSCSRRDRAGDNASKIQGFEEDTEQVPVGGGLNSNDNTAFSQNVSFHIFLNGKIIGTGCQTREDLDRVMLLIKKIIFYFFTDDDKEELEEEDDDSGPPETPAITFLQTESSLSSIFGVKTGQVPWREKIPQGANEENVRHCMYNASMF